MMITKESLGLPWKRQMYAEFAIKDSNGWGVCTTAGSSDTTIADSGTQKNRDNTDFILKACNCHYDLVVALESMADSIERTCGWNKTGLFPEDLYELLAKAKGNTV